MEADTVNILERSSYYQGNWTVDNYLDSFQILTSDAGYMDPLDPSGKILLRSQVEHAKPDRHNALWMTYGHRSGSLVCSCLEDRPSAIDQ